MCLLANFTSKAQGYTRIETINIYFKTNQYKISEKQEQQILNYILPHKENKELGLYTEAFTDEKGSSSVNNVLAQKRAESVAAILKKIKPDYKDIEFKGKGVDTVNTIDSLQRRAAIYMSLYVVCGTRNTTKDTLHLEDTSYFKNLKHYNDSQSMIRDSVFALDVEDKFLKTGGMLTFQLTNELVNDPNFKTKTITGCIPLTDGEKFDDKMTLWITEKNKKGQTRWKAVQGTVIFDKNNQCYKFYLPCGNFPNPKDGMTYGINLDKPAQKIVYISTFKKYFFNKIEITNGKFSAIVKNKHNIDIFVFAFDEENLNYQEIYFVGYFTKNGEEKILRLKLGECLFEKFDDNDYFLQTKKTNYFINEVEYNKKGFWSKIKQFFKPVRDTY